jgi:acyl-CoA reductase-like NAD-dependent aldehyde dehydrogenase
MTGTSLIQKADVGGRGVAGAGPQVRKREEAWMKREGHDPVSASAFTGWVCTVPRRRSEILRRARELMMQDREQFARQLGRRDDDPLGVVMDDIAQAAEFLRRIAEDAVPTGRGTREAAAGDLRTPELRTQAGIAALIAPWN